MVDCAFKILKTIFNKLTHIIMGWYYKAFNKNENLAKYRMNICKNCKHKINILNEDVCNLCGCVLDAKTRVIDETCYDNKW